MPVSAAFVELSKRISRNSRPAPEQTLDQLLIARQLARQLALRLARHCERVAHAWQMPKALSGEQRELREPTTVSDDYGSVVSSDTSTCKFGSKRS